jgi:hypothetical protein
MTSDGTDLYITNYNESTGTIGKYSLSGTVLNASFISGLSGPKSIAVADGEIYEVNQVNETVESFSTSTGAANPTSIPPFRSPPVWPVFPDRQRPSSDPAKATIAPWSAPECLFS